MVVAEVVAQELTAVTELLRLQVLVVLVLILMQLG
jgi:hypothetical protein